MLNTVVATNSNKHTIPTINTSNVKELAFNITAAQHVQSLSDHHIIDIL